MSTANNSLKILPLVLIAMLVVGWGNTATPANRAEGRGLFVDVPAPATAKGGKAPVDATIVRSRLVKIDWDTLALAEDSSGRKIISGDVLLLNLFDDTSLTARLYHGQARSEEHFIWTGHVEGDRGS